METLKILEDRITILEKKIYGVEKTLTMDDKLPENPVIDNLLHANTLISSALSGREKANAIIKRLPELSDYLEPLAEEVDLPLASKLQLILTTEPDIREKYGLLTKVQEFQSVLGTECMQNVPEMTTKLNDLTLIYMTALEESEKLNAGVTDIFRKYDAVINSISQSLVTLDAAVTAAEVAALPKKIVD